MEKKIDLAAVLAGEYKETIDIIEGLSIVCSPMTFAEREEVSRKEKVEFISDPNASVEKERADINMFIGKNMAKFVIKSAKVSDKELIFKTPIDVEKWLDSLTSSIAEMVVGSITSFVAFYVNETEATWNSDPFGLRKIVQKQSSPQEASN